MRIVVCLKEVVDTSLDMAFGQVSHQLWQKGLVAKLNPADAGALSLALKLKQQIAETEITLITIGPLHTETWLRQGLGWGASRAIRICETAVDNLTAYRKAKILARAIALCGADIILTGNKSLDNGSGQVGPYLAAWMNIPCICNVISLDLDINRQEVTVTRNIRRGTREKVLSTLPVVLTVEVQNSQSPMVGIDQLLESQEKPITTWSINDLGLSPQELNDDPTEAGMLSFPRPRIKGIATPDSSLPAFYRILALLEGGIRKRRSEILQCSNTELADQLFYLLLKEGILKPATPDTQVKPQK